MSDRSTIRLRGHHLLCLHGYRGLGYSPEFISNMWLVRDRLLNTPDAEVEVTTSPDDICCSCPHLSDGRCVCKDEESEARIREKDGAVLRQIGLSSGDRCASHELFGLVTERFSGGLEGICSSCRWYSLGWCEEGIRNKVMLLPVGMQR